MKTAIVFVTIIMTFFICAQSEAVDKRDGFILMSDGTKYEGELLMRSAMKFYTDEKGKSSTLMKVLLSEICKIEVLEEFAEYEETYFFPEEGKKIKEWTGKYSPRKKFSLNLYLADGQELKGTSTFQIYLMKKDEQPQRFDFRKDLHGKEGQNLDELIHISEMFFAEPVKKESGKISGSVKTGEKIEKIIAYARSHQRTYNGIVDADKGKFELRNLPEDTYDLCIICEKTISLSAGAVKPENATDAEETPVTVDDKTKLDEKIQKQIGRSEFFDKVEVLELTGWRGSATAVVLKERTKTTHLDESDKKHTHLPRRIEIWLLHMTEDEWVIDKRIYLYREVCIDEEKGHSASIEIKLKGIEISKDKVEQTVDLTKSTDK